MACSSISIDDGCQSHRARPRTALRTGVRRKEHQEQNENKDRADVPACARVLFIEPGESHVPTAWLNRWLWLGSRELRSPRLCYRRALFATLVDEEDDSSDDDSSVASLPFDNGGFLDSFRSMDGAAGDGQQLSSAAVSAAAEGHPIFPEAAATAATEFTTPPDELYFTLPPNT
ncbi:hypothetical protein MRX96_045132 [Rhipicephalus microplus]